MAGCSNPKGTDMYETIDVTALAKGGALWCPTEPCAWSEHQPLQQTAHDASLYRCSYCGTDWTLDALDAAYRQQEVA